MVYEYTFLRDTTSSYQYFQNFLLCCNEGKDLHFLGTSNMVPTQRQIGGLSAAVLLLLLSNFSGITLVGVLLCSEFG